VAPRRQPEGLQTPLEQVRHPSEPIDLATATFDRNELLQRLDQCRLCGRSSRQQSRIGRSLRCRAAKPKPNGKCEYVNGLAWSLEHTGSLNAN
jgi:hypothetical protein